MSRKHDEALRALIRSIPEVSTKTFTTKIPATAGVVAAPYVIIRSADGTDSRERHTGPAVTQHPRWTIHSVGIDTEQAKWLAEKVKAKLIVGGLGVSVTIAGERPGPFWYSSPIPVQVDDDFSPPLHYHVAECGFSSDPV